MKHKGIVTRLCYFLIQGYGINSALAELGLTTTYLTERIRRIDRVRLHQAHDSYVEGLNREVVQRARLGRHTGTLKRVIDDLPPFCLPGDDKDEARAYREWRRRNFASDDDGVIVDVDNSASLSDLRRLLEISGPTDDEDDDAIETINPAKEAPAAPRRRLHANETPLALESPQAVEELHQQPAEAVEEGVETASAEPDTGHDVNGFAR